MTERVDAVVIGASIRGLVTAYVLSSLGYRAVLLERGRRVGGADSSFLTAGGTRFEHGLHVLDAHRSELATRLFTRILDGEVHEVVLRRAIVLRGLLMPYSPTPAEMPPALRDLLPRRDLEDDLGDALPTRDRLSRCYGQPFTDLVFDEVLPSFPSEARHLAFGVDEARLLTNIYPWFFPRARRASSADESRAFHDRLRAGIEQRILYPKAGGFGGFAEGFVRQFDPACIEVLTGIGDLSIDVVPGTHTIESVSTRNRRFTAPHYFWAGSWSALCDLLGIPCQQAATDRVLLGSFRLDRPAGEPWHEILVGDPAHHLNRVSFPARFRESDDPLMQVEFAVPTAETWPTDADHWQRVWVDSARRLGLLDAAHRVEEFDFRSFVMHFNGFGAEGEPLRDADPALLQPGSNVRPVVPSMANLNLNRHVPRSVSYVASVLAGDREPFGDAGT
jgi:glycine/D-amino acid oxidase-like deaminating enzyme